MQVGHHQIVELDEQRCALHRIELHLCGLEGLVVVLVAPACEVAAGPLVDLLRNLFSRKLLHEVLRVRLRHRGGEHLHVGPELLVGVRVGEVAAEKHRSDHAFQLQVDAGLGAGVFDDGLALLAWPAHGRLIDELELDVALGADAVGALLPAGGLEHGVGLLGVELVLRVRAAKARRVVEKVGRGDGAAAVNHFGNALAVDEQAHRFAQRLVAEGRVLALDTGALAIDLVPGVGNVERDELDVAARIELHAAFACGFQALEDLVFDGQVPGQVVFGRLQHGARGAGGVAPAFDLQRVEERLVGDVVVLVGFGAQDVAWPEIDDLVRARAHGFEVGRVVAGLGAHEGLEHVLGQDGTDRPGEGLGPEGCGFGVVNAHGVRVDLRDLDVAVGAHRLHGRSRVASVLGGEDDVVRGEVLAVVPLHSALELPDDPAAIARDAVVGARWNLGGQDRDHVAFTVPSGQRLIEHAAGVLVLGAARVMRVQMHCGLPVEDLECAATTALGGLVGDGRGCLRDAFVHQHHRRHRRRQAQAHHLLNEAAPGQLAFADVFDQGAQFTFLHDASP